jgi:intracellular multiplication protein IcmK
MVSATPSDNSGGLSALFSQRNNANNASTNGAQTGDPIEPPPKRRPTMRDEAFRQLLDKISPLTPDQIIEMRKQQDKTQQAVATLPNTPPRPVSSTLTIDLSPGVTPPVVRLGAGFVSSLVFVDSTGQPWPIADYSLGNPKNFNIQWDRKTNTLFVQGNTTYSSGNLAVRLGTLDTPVMLTLISGQREVDYRVDLQVRGRGPNATAPVVGDNLPVQNPLLLSVLDGVAPPGSTELIVCPELGRAWIVNGKLIFRTRVTILSPAWSATVSSADGTRVYEMMQTPLILGSENGHPVNIELRGL